MARIEVDISGVEELTRELEVLTVQITGRLGERGYQLMRREVPVQSGNLKQGIAAYLPGGKTIGAAGTAGRPVSRPNRAEVIASARSARRGPRRATLHLKSGKTKEITLRSQASYNYAEVVARGHKKDRITPKRGKALLIPVPSAPSDESYITEGGQIYVVRKSVRGRGENPYDERAARQLEKEAPVIVEAVARKLFDG